MPNPTLAQMGFLDEDTQQEVVYDIEDSEARSDISALENKIGSANGIAELDGNGLVPASQLPSYVDDVLEGTAQNVTETAAGTFAATGFILKGELIPCTPEDGKTYVDTTSNIQYRWTGSGTNFVSMGSNLTLGETSSTAYAGNKGKANADAIAGMKNGSSIDSFGDVETALAGKVDKVQGKGLSTNDYDNTAKGIVDNIRNNVIANTKLIKDTVGWSGKNKLPITANTQTVNGITATVNSDKSVTINGTATANTWIYLNLNFMIPRGTKVKLSGNPSGSNLTIQCIERVDSSTIAKNTQINAGTGETEITIDNTTNYMQYLYYIANGKIVSNVTFYPMIRPADILDDTYEPYFGSTVFPRSEQSVLGAKNLLPNNKGTETVKDVVYTVATDGSISVSGQIQAPNTFTSHWISLDDLYLENGKKYILNGCPEGGGSTTYFLRLGYGAIDSSTDTNTFVARDEGNGVEFTADGSKNYRVQIRINTTEAISNKVFKPMIRLASDPDDTYAPYAMTNKELTEKAIKFVKVLTSADNLNNITETGIYYVIDSAPTNMPEGKLYSFVEVFKENEQAILQRVTRPNNGIIYTRSGSPLTSWNSWYKIEGTVLS